MRTRSSVATALLLLALAASGCSSSTATPQPAKASPAAKRHYLHPTRDLGRVTADCDSDKEPYLTLWITNHADHDMAYDIKYDFVDAHGKTIGSAGGVFTVEAHGIIGDTRLFDTAGRCSTKARLAYVNAYDDSKDGADQPTF